MKRPHRRKAPVDPPGLKEARVARGLGLEHEREERSMGVVAAALDRFRGGDGSHGAARDIVAEGKPEGSPWEAASFELEADSCFGFWWWTAEEGSFAAMTILSGLLADAAAAVAEARELDSESVYRRLGARPSFAGYDPRENEAAFAATLAIILARAGVSPEAAERAAAEETVEALLAILPPVAAAQAGMLLERRRWRRRGWEKAAQERLGQLRALARSEANEARRTSAAARRQRVRSAAAEVWERKPSLSAVKVADLVLKQLGDEAGLRVSAIRQAIADLSPARAKNRPEK